VCTVTVVPHSSGARIVCNRDERRSRPDAEAPVVRTGGGLQTVWPRDPESGGTWIGTNEAGLVLVLINRNPRGYAPAPAGKRSRGTIIPALVTLHDMRDVLARVRQLNGREFEPFTLLAYQRTRLLCANNIGAGVNVNTAAVSRPMVFTSSSLGDHLVCGPRRELFARLVCGTPAPLDGQRAFHRHAWTHRPEISVCMSRPDAATVSRTVIDVDRARVRLQYSALPH
jgi:hypothetical protein